MSTNLLHSDEVCQIIGASLAVPNGTGHGLDEKPYENALAVEFTRKPIPFNQQKRYPVVWRDVLVGDRITDHERGQMINHLRITGLKLGLIINFKKTSARMGADRPHQAIPLHSSEISESPRSFAVENFQIP